jgi:hypothetical protein
MPYIPATRKSTVFETGPYTLGELNYVITKTCLDYLDTADNPGYAEYNEVIGVLECAKLELYRRAVAPYEDKKIVQNGDVYG